MLLIRRRPGESVLIGDNIELLVTEVAAGRVTLGFSAPREVVILRQEIQLAQEQNLAAALGVNAQNLSSFLSRIRGPESR